MSGAVKVLAIAYACNPYQGSEAGVGWGWIQMIGRHHETDVITLESHRSDIEMYISENGAQNINFHYIKHEPSRLLDKFFPLYYVASYRAWLNRAYRLANDLVAEKQFSLCHLITYVGFRFPGKFFRLGIPFVWGPIGGLENTSWHLLPLMGIRGRLYYSARNILNTIDKGMLRLPRKAFAAASKSGAVIAATSSIQREITHWYDVDSSVVCEIGVNDVEAREIKIRNREESLQIGWSGEHLPGKALPILLHALNAIHPDVQWHLDILGDGPCRSKWKALSERLGLNNRCHWHGKIPRDKALEVMKASHVFVITSIKDLTSTVLLEALSLGLPVICPDHCGFSDVVDASCGQKIPLRNVGSISRAFADALEEMNYNEERRQALARGALERAKQYSWEKKSHRLESIYRKVGGGVGK